MQVADDTPLPPLREDLSIAPGAPLLSGAPSWVIYDPLRHRFFQIGQQTVAMLACWSAGSIGALRQRLQRERALEIPAATIETLIGFLQSHQLILSDTVGTAKRMAAQAAQTQGGWWRWLSHKYIFFRVPLLRPQRFLEASWPLVAPLFSRGFVALTAMLLLLALYLTGRQWTDVLQHFSAAFTLSGVGAYIAAIVLVKILHELGHAYQAVGRGLQVPTMGVAFLVMFPLLYTDVTDAWRLTRRRDRMLIDAGGIMAEMTVAVYATLLWCFLPDGALRSATFALATTSWFFSLLVNMNPLMRFDGYYFLADALGIHNLQPRSFAFGKWALRRALFGLADAPPESLGQRLTIFMVIYAYCVWVYRFFLFLAIALLVYAMAFKALGVVLLVIEIAFFIVRPVMQELREWWGLRRRIVSSRRSWFSLMLFGGLLALAFWPRATPVKAPALLELAAQQQVFIGSAARLRELFIHEGQWVAAGDPIATFEAPELPLEIAQSEVRIAMLDSRLLSAAGDASERDERLILLRQLEEERQRLAALVERQAELQVVAELNGRVVELLSDIAPGVWIEPQQPLARIVGDAGLIVRGLIEEKDRVRLDARAGAVFIPDDISLRKIELMSLELADYAIEALPDGYLAASHGGPIAVSHAADGRLTPRDVWYPLSARVTGQQTDFRAVRSTPIPGVIVLKTHPEAWAKRIGRQIARVLITEMSF